VIEKDEFDAGRTNRMKSDILIFFWKTTRHRLCLDALSFFLPEPTFNGWDYKEVIVLARQASSEKQLS